ncbi:hypothetical protein HID58_069788 [Brassica napus]|uniref:Peptidase S9A N-terminal domain-containing protein n=1 Tax=Brassica napus TaxID=3708 RepID=A0ABQ7YWY6_BRANA|nr:hypothetical protein HID58_069788 [Brassica napus]
MEYAQHCRRLIADNKAEPSVYDTMPIGPEALPEHIILDENIKAQEYDYYSIGAFKASPDHKLVAYAEDTKGVEIYTVNVTDSEALKSLGEPLKGLTCYLQWAARGRIGEMFDRLRLIRVSPVPHESVCSLLVLKSHLRVVVRLELSTQSSSISMERVFPACCLLLDSRKRLD